MKTYEDLQNASNKMDFVQLAISTYKASDMYKEAKIGYDYYCKRNTTILNYQKLLYTLSGQAVPDNFSANYKLCNGFFSIFVKQEKSYLLGNGVTFEEEETKDKIGGADFDRVLMELCTSALWGGVSYGFWNLDHIDPYTALEFVPLYGEDDGALRSGIRFWQADNNKPLRATLFEEDGYTNYIWRDGEGSVLTEKRAYVLNVVNSVVEGTEILDGVNYPTFPIVPLYGNMEHQSELVGLREKIDGYDLIQSGFANDLDDASQIYWTISNAGGMDDIDLKKFIERLKVVKATTVDDNAHAEAHTLEVPYNARITLLENLRTSLYRDAMALDVDKMTAGNITATGINASYSNLDLKVDDLEYCVTSFIQGILKLIDVEDYPTYKRNKIINQEEETQMILSCAQFLDVETLLKHLPFLSPDEIQGILDRIVKEEADRYGQGEEGNGQEAETDGEETP